VAAALAVATLIVACGGGGAGLASLAPPDTPLYAEFALQPDEDHAESIAALGERLAQGAVAEDPGVGRLAPYLARLDSLVTGATVEDGLELSRITLTLAD